MNAYFNYSNCKTAVCTFILCMALQGCVGTITGAAVDTTIEVVKIPFKVVGAVVDLALPDDKDEDED